MKLNSKQMTGLWALLFLWSCSHTNPSEEAEDLPQQTKKVGWTWEEVAVEGSISPGLIKKFGNGLVFQDFSRESSEFGHLVYKTSPEESWKRIPQVENFEYDATTFLIEEEKIFFGGVLGGKLVEFNALDEKLTYHNFHFKDSIESQNGFFPMDMDSTWVLQYVQKYGDQYHFLFGSNDGRGILLPWTNAWCTFESETWDCINRADTVFKEVGWDDYTEFNGQLFMSTTGEGVWKMDENYNWHPTLPPDSIVFQGDVTYRSLSRAMEVVNGKLYVIFYSAGTYEYQPETNSWKDLTACPEGKATCYPTPRGGMGLASYQGRLISTDRIAPIPAWYNFETQEWNHLSFETWEQAFPKGTPYVGQSYDLEVIGDTLYVANANGIVKLDLSDPAVWTPDTTDTKRVPIEVVNEVE